MNRSRNSWPPPNEPAFAQQNFLDRRDLAEIVRTCWPLFVAAIALSAAAIAVIQAVKH
jgi:hypothetical protein